ncbi:hypothetical protein HU200_039815 [Digitaria exilis]|uniref:Tetratricopeptide repeat protein n=1 Tax=Digitaria exilis TaxID=1010633 RepID=A0A835B9X6_9POAL|nr:hypothetical protein HU200_039815 [Digitaria exilis]
MMSPRWSKAWYREGAALSLLKDYKGAVDAFVQALKLDPASEEIRKALMEAMDAMKSAVAPARVEHGTPELLHPLAYASYGALVMVL